MGPTEWKPSPGVPIGHLALKEERERIDDHRRAAGLCGASKLWAWANQGSIQYESTDHRSDRAHPSSSHQKVLNNSVVVTARTDHQLRHASLHVVFPDT